MKREYLIVRTPETCWGNVRLANTRLTVEFMVARFNAGESIAELSKDYDVEPAAIEAMVRAVSQASYGRCGLLLPVRRRLERAADEAAKAS